jgi:hypothetical protein
MKVMLGIPDDTPENTAKSIERIVKEEAEALGLEFRPGRGRLGIKETLAIDVPRNELNFRVDLCWVNCDEIGDSRGSIGNGSIAGTRKREGSVDYLVHWDLELLSGDPRTEPLGWDPVEPIPTRPFRWGLYPSRPGREGQNMHTQPTHVLDGALLRKLLRDSLFSGQP